METKFFKYPRPIEFGKNYTKFGVIFILSLLVFLIFKNTPSEFKSQFEHYTSFLSPFIVILFALLYYCNWSNITVKPEGLEVEMPISKVFVPWNKILRIQKAGTHQFGVYLVVTEGNSLTWLHRIYSLFTIGSLKPGLPIHSQISNFELLIKIINKEINK